MTLSHLVIFHCLHFNIGSLLRALIGLGWQASHRLDSHVEQTTLCFDHSSDSSNNSSFSRVTYKIWLQ